MKNLTELEYQIVHYNAQYRDGQPEISDQEYDLLLERLKKEQPNSPLLKKGVIEQPKQSRKVTLPVKMMSLEKEKTFSGIISWLDEYGDPEIVITPKFDGISILRTPDKCLTRGDGFIGQDCTQHCNFLPHSSGTMKGELIILKSTWGEKDVFRKYKHPRNTVAGWINGDYDSQVPYHTMSFIAYEVIGTDFWTKSEQLIYLRDATDFNSAPFFKIKKSSLTETELDKLFNLWSKHYPLDGLVIELNDSNLRIGEHSNGNPVYMVAYKPPHYTEVAETVIKSVELAVNRYGMVTPTIIFETVNISGADLSRVNGVNMSYIYDWGLYPGEKIKIIRSGEVIPKIIEVGSIRIPFIEEFTSTKEYEKNYESYRSLRSTLVPEGKTESYMDIWCTCPYCDSTLKWDENMVNQFCSWDKCSERKFQEVIDYFKIFEVENIARGTIDLLWREGYDSVKKILGITKAQLLEIPGFAEKSATDFIYSILKLKKEGGSLAKHMHASGFFPNLGEKTLQLILDSTSCENIPKKEDLVTINGIGEVTADVFLKGLKDFIYDSEETEVRISYRGTPKKEKQKGSLSESVFCFTGCRPSSQLRERLENQGAEIVENFTSKVTHLVTKDKNSTSFKTEKAKKMGISIISIEDFM